MERLKNWGRKIRSRNVVKNQIQEGKKYMAMTDLEADAKARKLNEDLKGIMRQKKDKTVVKQVIDQTLAKIDVNWRIKLEAQFEHDYPGRKSIWRGNPTGLFKQWLKSKDLFDKYFKEG